MTTRAYYLAHREEMLAAASAYARAHRDERNAYRRERRRTHGQEKRAGDRAYYYAHPARRDQRAKYIAHRDAIRATTAAYKRAHPERVASFNGARRARKFGNGGSHTVSEWLAKCVLLGNVCIYCGEAKKLTRDHKIPLVRGGTDAIENIVPACQSCNSRKRSRTAEEFIAARLAEVA